ncbi:hypothetical protein C8T65DRAFT_744687 [Cerioporus squamosus]|nr:hypothetical protein C8T65DRAFT_744687 [Cerioporus squamosus]
MASFPRWFDKAKATGARLISCDAEDASRPQRRRKRDSDYADIPPFLLPLSIRVRLDKDKGKDSRKARSRSAPYHKDRDIAHQKRRTKLKMPTVLKRLTGPPTCPIVVAQYKDEFRGVGHEADLHWALVVITDRATLSGPSFQAYAQKRRLRRPRARSHPQAQQRHHLSGSDEGSDRAMLAHANGGGAAWFGSGTNAIRSESAANLHSAKEKGKENGGPDASEDTDAREYEYETQWYTRHAPASLFDVSATVRSLCLGGVQVGSVRAADVGKLVEYLASHPPVPSHRGWCSRDYVLELLELLRPFKMLRPDLQGIHLRAAAGERREVGVEDLLPDLKEVGRATQESIFQEEFRPCVKYAS